MSGSGLIDRADERLKQDSGVGGAIRAFLDRVRSGDLGSLPVIVGLLIICGVFESLNPIFLSSNNLVNLLYDSSTVGVISLGIVCILMVGEIDLSVGSVSGFASALVGVLWVNAGLPVILAIVAAVAAGAVIGFVYALLFNRFGMPSFVSTLSGLLAVLGLQLYILGESGSINLPYGSAMVDFGQSLFMPAPLAYVIAALAGALVFWTGLRTARRRRAANLSSQSLNATVAARDRRHGRARARGVLHRPRSRRALDARLLPRARADAALCADADEMGAARSPPSAAIARRRAAPVSTCARSTRACSCCARCSRRSAACWRRPGSPPRASRRGTGDVNLDAIAAAVIGGTSLFGGRGSAFSALLGIIVIEAISNGLTLLDLSSSLRYMITGAVLAVAVIVDSLARRSRVSHGRA